MNKSIIFLLAILLSIFSSIARNNENSPLPECQIQKRKIKTVVIFGNNIVAHPVSPKLGWYVDWGMAASARDSDFVHRLISDIHQIDKFVDVRYQNISVFENNYETFDFSQLSAYRNADMIIVKISENVKPETPVEKNFILHYDQLIKYLAPTDSTVKIIVDGFWPSLVNDIIKDYALK